MFTAVFLAFGLRPDLPPAEALDRFPVHDAYYQINRCQDHLARLRVLRRVRGWEGGRWDDAIAETEFRLGYWRALNDAWWIGDPDLIPLALDTLKRHIGPKRFRDGWRPPELPGPESFPRFLPPEPSRPPANPRE